MPDDDLTHTPPQPSRGSSELAPDSTLECLYAYASKSPSPTPPVDQTLRRDQAIAALHERCAEYDINFVLASSITCRDDLTGPPELNPSSTPTHQVIRSHRPSFFYASHSLDFDTLFDPAQPSRGKKIIQKTLAAAAPVRYSDIFDDNAVKKEIGPLFNSLRNINIVDGIGMHVTMPGGMTICINMGLPYQAQALSDKALYTLRSYAQYFFRQAAYPDCQKLPSNLSPRELTVIRLISDGLSNKEIARKLQISTSTVSTVLERCFAKLNVHSRVHAVFELARNGLLW